MYCPNCGAQALPDRKFCRSCGADFYSLLLAIAGPSQKNESLESIIGTIAKFQSQKERMKRWGFITTWLGILLGACFIVLSGILAILDKPVSGLAGSMSGWGLLISLIGMGMMIYSRFLPDISLERESFELKAIKRSDTGGKVISEAYGEQVVSVTEKTTEPLGNYVTDIERRRESGELRA